MPEYFPHPVRFGGKTATGDAGIGVILWPNSYTRHQVADLLQMHPDKPFGGRLLLAELTREGPEDLHEPGADQQGT